VVLNALTRAYLFEKDLYLRCRDQRLKRTVRVIDGRATVAVPAMNLPHRVALGRAMIVEGTSPAAPMPKGTTGARSSAASRGSLSRRETWSLW
jgi:hypothetical protein